MPRLNTKTNQGRKQRSFWQRVKDKGLTLPGYNYLGPFNARNNGPPTNPSDQTAQTHDDEYQELQQRGANPYRYYNQADADADSGWGSDIGGRTAKRVFRIKKELAKRNIIGEIPRGRSEPTIQPSLRGLKRKQPEGFSRVQDASKRFRRMMQDIQQHHETTPQVNSTARQQVMSSAPGGEGSGNQGGLKETPVDDVWNVTRGPPNYTFASLPWVISRKVSASISSYDFVYRMTSPYDPQNSTSVIDTNTGAGTQPEQIASATDASAAPARWYNFYASSYRYYHVVAARWRCTIENLTMEPMWAHVMYRNDENPPQSATNQDILYWPGTKSHYIGPAGYAIASNGVEYLHKEANADDDEDMAIPTTSNFETTNHITGGARNIVKFQDEYRPGDYDREIRLDTEVENWTRCDTNPTLPERLFIRIRPDADAIDTNSALDTYRTLQFNIKFEIEYLCEFKELAAGLRYPVQRQPATVTIAQSVTTSKTTEPVVAAP